MQRWHVQRNCMLTVGVISINQWTGIGSIVHNPRITYTQSGIARASFLLSVPRNRGQTDETDYIAIIAWGQTAIDVRDYAQQGASVGIAGVLQTRNYVAQDGKKRYVTEVIAGSVDYLDRAPEKQVQEGSKNDCKQ